MCASYSLSWMGCSFLGGSCLGPPARLRAEEPCRLAVRGVRPTSGLYVKQERSCSSYCARSACSNGRGDN